MGESKELKALRVRAGFDKQEQFYEALKINDALYKGVYDRKAGERGAKTQLSTLIKIADALNCSIDYLVGRSDYVNVGNEECSEITGLSDQAIEALRKWKSMSAPGTIPGWNAMISDLIEGEDNFLEGKGGSLSVLSKLFHYTQPESGTFKLHNTRRKGSAPCDYEEEEFQDNELAMIYDNGAYFLSAGYISLLFRDQLVREIDRYKSILKEEFRNNGKEGPAVTKSNRIRSDEEILKEVYAAFEPKGGTNGKKRTKNPSGKV